MKITQPKYRSQLRKTLGREYFIFKRKLANSKSNISWAKKRKVNFSHEVFHHKSLVLRELSGIDMQLQENKRKNLELAILHLNGLVLEPNEVFSIWKEVGRPTKRKGYLSGLVLESGNVKEGTGGGLCQLGNLLFWVFVHSPLDVIERHRHGFDVFPDVKRKVPFGAGATLAYNYIDLKVKNNTDNTFKIKLWLDETHLHGELRCNAKLENIYSIEERNHQISQQIWGGYSRHNQIVKLTTNKTGETSEQLLVENHAIMMYEPFLNE